MWFGVRRFVVSRAQHGGRNGVQVFSRTFDSYYNPVLLPLAVYLQMRQVRQREPWNHNLKVSYLETHVDIEDLKLETI